MIDGVAAKLVAICNFDSKTEWKLSCYERIINCLIFSINIDSNGHFNGITEKFDWNLKIFFFKISIEFHVKMP